jgi:hypothetical protein
MRRQTLTREWLYSNLPQQSQTPATLAGAGVSAAIIPAVPRQAR